MRVLLIEDDGATAHSLALVLRANGFNVAATDLGEEGVDLGLVYDYDLILLDLSLPDMSGVEVLRMLRRASIGTPIMILSGSAELATKVRTFGFGADDYLTKPFDNDELVARVRAVIRRSKGHGPAVITVGPISVNLADKSVRVDGEPVYLTTKEYQIVELLAQRRGATVTKEMFITALYGGIDEPDIKIIDVFVCKIRRKISEVSGGERFIENVRGLGYVLRDPGGGGQTAAA